MKSVSGREFARLVERRGWKLLRISGSHHIFTAASDEAGRDIRQRSLIAASSLGNPRDADLT